MIRERTLFISMVKYGFLTYFIATKEEWNRNATLINRLSPQGGLTEGLPGLKSKIFRIKYARIKNFTI